ERLLRLGVPVRRGNHAFPDDAVLPDDERFRHARALVIVPDSSRRVVEGLEVEPELLREITDWLLHSRIVDADGDDPEPFRLHLPIEPLQARHLGAARRAPGGPEIEQDHVSLVVGDCLRPGDGFAVRRAECDRHRAKVRRLAARLHLGEVAAEDLRGGHDRDGRHDDDADDECPLPGAAHTVSTQSARNARISAAGSFAPKTALPATKVSAPARQHASIVSRATPPSTSRAAPLLALSRIARARRILSTEPAMKGWAPNPGLPLLMRSKSRSAATSRTQSTGVPGFITAPAAQPSSLMRVSCRWRCGATSTWMVN